MEKKIKTAKQQKNAAIHLTRPRAPGGGSAQKSTPGRNVKGTLQRWDGKNQTQTINGETRVNLGGSNGNPRQNNRPVKPNKGGNPIQKGEGLTKEDHWQITFCQKRREHFELKAPYRGMEASTK